MPAFLNMHFAPLANSLRQAQRHARLRWLFFISTLPRIEGA